MQVKNNKSGFTLLEIIIVIIIVGVLASLALPKFFRTVEYSRGTEALSNLNAVRQSMERCYLQRGAYTNCNTFNNLDLEDPAGSPNSHYDYSWPAIGATTFTLRATRNTRDGTNAGDQINLIATGTAINRSGTGAYVGIQ